MLPTIKDYNLFSANQLKLCGSKHSEMATTDYHNAHVSRSSRAE